jgi:hypothetical protein
MTAFSSGRLAPLSHFQNRASTKLIFCALEHREMINIRKYWEKMVGYFLYLATGGLVSVH